MYYKDQLYQELSSDAYENVTESRKTILERHKAFNISHDLEHVDNLAYLYGTPKMHKKTRNPDSSLGFIQLSKKAQQHHRHLDL